MSVLFEPGGWKARRSVELVYLFALGRRLLKRYMIIWVRRLDDIKGGALWLWKEGMEWRLPGLHAHLHVFFLYRDCDLCSVPFPS